MAYTNVWNEATPAGSAAANTVDDWLRQEKLDMRERLNSIIGAAVGAPLSDPVTPAGYDLATLGPLAVAQAFSVYLPWSVGAAQGTQTSPNPAYLVAVTPTNGDGVTYNSIDALAWYMPVVLPLGVIVTQVDAIWYSTGTQTPTHNFRRVTPAGSSALISTLSSALTNAGYQTKTLFSGTETIAAAFYRVHIAIPSSNTCAFVGLVVTYVSPTANYRI